MVSEIPPSLVAEIAEERARQDAKWGEQNHPNGTGDYLEIIEADVARMACEGAAEGGYLDWLHILREEVCEAFAESDPARIRAELVQVAAVAVAWVEAIDRREVRPPADEVDGAGSIACNITFLPTPLPPAAGPRWFWRFLAGPG